MTISYSLSEDDYLTSQLFAATKSPQVKKVRQKVHLLSIVAYALVALIALLEMKYGLAIMFTVLAVLMLFFYPLYQRRRFLRHYKDYVQENYKTRFGKTTTLEINQAFLRSADEYCDTKILCIGLESIDEIGSLILPNLKDGQTLIIAKDQIAEIDEVRKTLQELAASLGIEYNIDEKWKWK